MQRDSESTARGLRARLAGLGRPAPTYDDLERALLDRVGRWLDPATGEAGAEAGPAPLASEWVVALSGRDAARHRRRLAGWSTALADALLAADRRRGHPLGGVVTVRVERDDRLAPGTFTVRRATAGSGGGPPEVVPDPDGAPAPGRPRLVLPRGGSATAGALPDAEDRDVLLGPGRVVLGRGPEAHVRLADVSVSARHAELEVRPDGAVRVRDAGSANGLRVNGVRVLEAELADGHRVDLGEASLVFRRDAEGTEPGRQGGELGAPGDGDAG